MGGATIGTGGQYPPHLTKVRGTRGSTQVTKSISFNAEFIVLSSCNYSEACFIFLATPCSLLKSVVQLDYQYDTIGYSIFTCVRNLTRWSA